MNFLRRLLRNLFVWWLPALVMLMLCVAGFAAWLVGSQAGTRVLLGTVAAQLDGHAEGIEGSLWRGVRVRSMAVSVGGTQVEIDNLNLAADWPRLTDRLLRVQDLSADAVRVAMAAPAQAEEGEGGGEVSVPSLPVRIAVDRLAIGRFSLLQDGRPLPVTIDELVTTVAVGEGAQLRIASLRLGHPMLQTDLQGEVRLDELAAPWPMRVQLLAALHGAGPDSPVCLNELRPLAGQGTPARPGNEAAAKARHAKEKSGPAKAASTLAVPVEPDTRAEQQALAEAGCTVLLDANAQGSLEHIDLTLKGEGSGVNLAAQAALAPQGDFPLKHADLELNLANGASLAAKVDWQRSQAGPQVLDRLQGSVEARKLDLGALLAGTIPPALLSATLGFDVELLDQRLPTQAKLDLAIAEGSRWNKQPLSGTLRATLQAPVETTPATSGAGTIDWLQLRIPALQTDLRLGKNRVRTSGSWGETNSKLALDIAAPVLAAFWPDLPGGATVKGEVGGTPAAHRAVLQGVYTPAQPRPGRLGEAPANARFSLAGGWGAGSKGQFQPGLMGWRGTVSAVDAEHAGFGLDLREPMSVAFLPSAQAPQWQWQAGPATLAAALPGNRRITLRHEGSRGGGQRWQSAGRIDEIVVSPRMVRDILRAVGQETDDGPDRRGGVRMSERTRIDRSITLGASWNLQFANALSGTASIVRRAGDLLLPGQPPTPVDLRELSLDLRATPTSGNASRVDAALRLLTGKVGNLDATAQAMLAGLALDPRQPMRANIQAALSDISWVSLFTGDSLDIGGSLNANLQGEGRLNGEWQAGGTLKGENLRVIRIDDGVRLVDGTLSARLENERFILESLRFPASLRVVPPEWRTREWITTNPDAKNGELRASGEWNLLESSGDVKVVLHRYPVVQRVDRYAMMSGEIDIEAALPSLSITGKLTADAGWASIEMLASVPTVDDDVVVVHDGQEIESSAGLKMSMVLDIDLGPRFYLTGMGLDSGLVGALQIRMRDGRLTADGQLRTRGGRFEAYGQRLHLRRGTITFQDTLDNPLLDIEALRLGEQVEAGVRVAGTARRPRIDLVSYPDVSETEKLSWLILGRGADQGGADAALLLSVGTALLGGDGEPFYRKFGLDDVGIRSGAMGSSGSLLPDTTVVSSVNQNSSQQLENQFLVASKRFSNGITLSVEQAMSGADTVARASYALSRRLSADLKGGAVNGIELVYRTFFLD